MVDETDEAKAPRLCSQAIDESRKRETVDDSSRSGGQAGKRACRRDARSLIGLGIATRRTARPALWMALMLSIAYLALGTLLLPRLWADPLGPLLKIAPIVVLNLVALAVLDDR